MPLSLILVALAVVAGLGLGALLFRRPKDDGAAAEFRAFAENVAALAATQNQLSGRLAALGEGAATAQAELARTLAERLDAVTKGVGESLEKTSEKTGKALGDLETRLTRIDEAQKRLGELSGQVVRLQDILDNKQRRGAFGEQILDQLVADALPKGIYEFQVGLSPGTRVDCLIRLPHPPGPVAIDAKFPLESYRAFVAAAEDAGRVAAGRKLSSDMQKHVSDIAEKYIVPGETADIALLFLPSEAIYADLHREFANVIENARRRRVYIVSPNTLMAMLTAIGAILKDARVREQAGIIQTEVGRLKDDVARLLDRVENLKKHFGQAEKDLKEVEISAGKIGRKADHIGALPLQDETTSESKSLGGRPEATPEFGRGDPAAMLPLSAPSGDEPRG